MTVARAAAFGAAVGVVPQVESAVDAKVGDKVDPAFGAKVDPAFDAAGLAREAGTADAGAVAS